jgi:hypothetical protein
MPPHDPVARLLRRRRRRLGLCVHPSAAEPADGSGRGYRYQPLSKFSLDGVQVAAGGHSQSAGAMMNILWDIPVPQDLAVQPFVGMGVGVMHTDIGVRGGGNT